MGLPILIYLSHHRFNIAAEQNLLYNIMSTLSTLFGYIGSPAWARTTDQLINSQLLYH